LTTATVVGGFAQFTYDLHGLKPKRLSETKPIGWRERRRQVFREVLRKKGLLDGRVPPEPVEPKADAEPAVQAPPGDVVPVEDVLSALPPEPAAAPAVEAPPAEPEPSDGFPPPMPSAMRWPSHEVEPPIAVSEFPLLPTEEPNPYEMAELRADYEAWQARLRENARSSQGVAAKSQQSDGAVLPGDTVIPGRAPGGKVSRPASADGQPSIVAIVRERTANRALDDLALPVREPSHEPRIIFRDRIVEKTVEVPGPERLVYRDAKPPKPKVITRRVTRADPIHPVMTGGKITGYQWGSSGKVYRSKAAAQKQAAAIYATGWRGDGHARRMIAKLMSANKAAENQYAREVVSYFKGVHKGVLGMVEAELLPKVETRADASQAHKAANELLNARLNKRIAKHLRDKVGPAFDVMAKRVSDKNEQSLGMIGITVDDVAAGVAAKIAVARENNLRLIEDAGRAYADDVRDVMTDPDNAGLRADELKDQLVQRGNVSVSRATLVAVDQTLKLSAAVNQARQVAAGVEQYKWSTSLDDRVRPMHAELEGQVFDWDDPPVTNDAGDTNHPGEDYRCRCVPIPLIPELDEESENAEPAGDDDSDNS
jgi:SPP1 gp7 family putative phage head morphogenesis protein